VTARIRRTRRGYGELRSTRPVRAASARDGQLRRRSRRLQGSAAPEAGIRAAGFRFCGIRRATFDSRGASGVGARRAVAAAKPTPSGICPAGGGDPSGRIPLLRNPAREQKEAHRVGLASVQLTRSTFAEATAGRESLRPSALRARCTRKPTGEFCGRQALRTRRDRKLRQFWTSRSFRDGFALESANSRKNAPRSVLPRPTYRLTSAEAFACRRAINLRRSFLGALGTLDPREIVVKHCWKREGRCLRFSFTGRTYLR
jgi:hypothetical protein